jgi:hypothetical protein
MGKGRLSWTTGLAAAALDGSHWFSQGEAAFNVGTRDFAVDGLFRVDGGSYAALVSKGTDPLTSDTGWVIYSNVSTRSLTVKLNDGQATPVAVSGDSAYTLGEWFWLRVTCDRDGLARIFANGVLKASGAISGRPGSLDAEEPLQVGRNGGMYLTGAVGLVRLDYGRLLSDSWMAAEWTRLQMGLRPRGQDFLAVWNFNGVSEDEGGAYPLAWQGGGAAAYGAGWPETVSYDLEVNYELGWTLEYLAEADLARSLDGSLTAYWPPGRRRRRLTLPFRFVSLAQVEALLAAYEAGAEIGVWLDSDLPRTLTGLITEPPLVTASSPGWYDVSLTLEEV